MANWVLASQRLLRLGYIEQHWANGCLKTFFTLCTCDVGLRTVCITSDLVPGFSLKAESTVKFPNCRQVHWEKSDFWEWF